MTPPSEIWVLSIHEPHDGPMTRQWYACSRPCYDEKQLAVSDMIETHADGAWLYETFNADIYRPSRGIDDDE